MPGELKKKPSLGISLVPVVVLIIALGYFIWQSQVRDEKADGSAIATAAVEPDVTQETVLEDDQAEEVRRSIAVLPFRDFSPDRPYGECCTAKQ